MHLSPSKLARFGLAITAAFTLCAASAAPLVTSWGYSVSGAFSTSPGDTTFTAGAGCQQVSATSITWGDDPCGPAGTGRSGIGISDSLRSGTVITNDTTGALANTYTHTNNAVSSANATLTHAMLNSTLTLTPMGGSALPAFSTTYAIDFAETPNATPCVVATSPTPCNDIFVLAGSLNNSFMFDGNTYFLSFFEVNNALLSLSPEACAATGASWPCIGFTTAEGQANNVQFAFTITAEPVVIDVPEPSSLALFGAALLGLVGIRRRYGQHKS